MYIYPHYPFSGHGLIIPEPIMTQVAWSGTPEQFSLAQQELISIMRPIVLRTINLWVCILVVQLCTKPYDKNNKTNYENLTIFKKKKKKKKSQWKNYLFTYP
jgi:hypothetical protein